MLAEASTEIWLAIIGFVVVAWKTADYVIKAVTAQRERRYQDEQRRLDAEAIRKAAEMDESDAVRAYAVAFRRISDCLQRIRQHTDALQVVLLVVHDSGGPIRIGVPLFSSVLLDARKTGPEVRRSWTKQRISPWYLSMLMDVERERGVTIVRDEIPEGEPLKGVYEMVGITHSRVKYVHTNSKMTHAYYVSVTLDREPDWEPAVRAEILTEVGVMRRILEGQPILPEY